MERSPAANAADEAAVAVGKRSARCLVPGAGKARDSPFFSLCSRCSRSRSRTMYFMAICVLFLWSATGSVSVCPASSSP